MHNGSISHHFVAFVQSTHYLKGSSDLKQNKESLGTKEEAFDRLLKDSHFFLYRDKTTKYSKVGNIDMTSYKAAILLGSLGSLERSNREANDLEGTCEKEDNKEGADNGHR